MYICLTKTKTKHKTQNVVVHLAAWLRTLKNSKSEKQIY